MGLMIKLLVLLPALLLGACASVQRPDPLEAMNRKVFAFNETVDAALLKPVASGYARLLPAPLRSGIDNFFANPRDLWSAANLLMQGRAADGLSDLMRVGTNSLFGVLGFFDVATPLGLPRHGEDFGQTLGHWGVASGAYIVWPLLGPSTLRDSAALPLDLAATPQTWLGHVPTRNSLSLLQLVNTRAELLSASRLLDEIALDKYLFVRDAYLQRRRSLVHNGEPPYSSLPGADADWQ